MACEVLNAQKWILKTTGEASWFTPEHAMVAKGSTPGDPIGDAVASLVRSSMPEDGQEHLVAVAMDAHGVPLAVSRLATGSVDQCPLFARDVYAWALVVPRVRFVGIAHNHPSGDVTPSGPDATGSTLVAKAGQMLSLELAWSMVVTHESDAWALVPVKATPKPGEREPHAPKDPDEDEPDAPETPDAPEPDDDDAPEDEDEGDAPEPDEDGDEDEDGEPDGDSDDDGEDETPGEDGDNPDGEDESEDESETPEGDEDGDEDGGAPDEGTGDPTDPVKAPKGPEASVDDLRAAILAAFKLNR